MYSYINNIGSSCNRNSNTNLQRGEISRDYFECANREKKIAIDWLHRSSKLNDDDKETIRNPPTFATFTIVLLYFNTFLENLNSSRDSFLV